MYLLRYDGFDIVGSSPESHLKITVDAGKQRTAMLHPIAGTRPRGESSAQDSAYASDLITDPKERSEHVMLVDLGRNDLGRVSRPGTVTAVRPAELVSRTPSGEFGKAVEVAKEAIRAGDCFQIVVSQRFETRTDADPLDVYRVLRTTNPSPYMYLLRFDDFDIVGSSPEAHVKITKGDDGVRRALLHPIAGTRPRGESPEADAALAAELIADPKERSEHVMLVDLGRNDLGRVSRAGTVEVPEFAMVERYSHVMHIVSTVVGELRAGVSPLDALAATFPAGTLSGAPKVRAMEIIEELEPTRRGLYGGTVGYFGFGGDLDMAIAIRTALLRDGVAYVQAGAGVVADSDPALEELETQNKAMAVLAAIATAQTLQAAR